MLFTSDTAAYAGSAPALLVSDIHPVVGCPFTVGPKYSPCLQVEWTAGATRASVRGTAVLIKTSIGKCINAESAPQGIAMIANTQIKASAQ